MKKFLQQRLRNNTQDNADAQSEDPGDPNLGHDKDNPSPQTPSTSGHTTEIAKQQRYLISLFILITSRTEYLP